MGETCRECRPHEHSAGCFTVPPTTCVADGEYDFVELCPKHSEVDALRAQLAEAQRYAVAESSKAHQEIVELRKQLEEARQEVERLRELLQECLDYAHNPFEPDNQSNHYKRLKDALGRRD